MASQKKPSKFPLSEGYLVVDPKKCAGCIACMLACSMVHEGKTAPSLSRIQVVQSAFQPFPDDISLNICRQCVNPLCVKACPTGALDVDSTKGNVRVVDDALCDGCRECFSACPYVPSRMVWNHDKSIAMKCDLCLDAAYWSQKGGPEGRQACVEICPMRAIKLVKEAPDQKGDAGYNVNLRNEHWEWLGFPAD
jgi:protein NrfC